MLHQISFNISSLIHFARTKGTGIGKYLKGVLRFLRTLLIFQSIHTALPREQKSLLSQLMYGTLGLEIERGKFTKTPRENRICTLCNEAVESETHFLFDCIKLTKTRNELYYVCPEVLNHESHACKLKYLLSKPYVLGKFVANHWHARMIETRMIIVSKY